MKIRKGFVSNSSSSSFILKVDKTEDGFIKIDPKNFGTALKNKEELDKYFLEMFSEKKIEDLDKYDKEVYDKHLKIINNGKIIIMGCIEQGGEDNIEGYFKGLDFEWE